jgi:hypothetical protein
LQKCILNSEINKLQMKFFLCKVNVCKHSTVWNMSAKWITSRK